MTRPFPQIKPSEQIIIEANHVSMNRHQNTRRRKRGADTQRKSSSYSPRVPDGEKPSEHDAEGPPVVHSEDEAIASGGADLVGPALDHIQNAPQDGPQVDATRANGRHSCSCRRGERG